MRLIAVSITFVLACLVILLSHTRRVGWQGKMNMRAHRIICIGVFLCGCTVRLAGLTALPAGISADEALLGVQAKALWQTGGFLFDGRLTAFLEQWAGEGCGPLLAAITAPFVGILGLSKLSVRLPLALLSCASTAAAYGVGKALGGKRAGRWCLTVFALCPYFVLSSRTAAGIQAAVCIVPIALALLAMGTRRPGLFCAGIAATALLAYAQDIFMLISPLVIVLCAAMAVQYGLRRRYALCAAALGLLLCLPAMLTCWVSLTGAPEYVLLGTVRIPSVESLCWEKSIFAAEAGNRYAWAHVCDKVWGVIESGFFQVMTHERVANAMFAPEYLLALYAISVPLLILGGMALATRWLRGGRVPQAYAAGRSFTAAACVVTLIILVLFGDSRVVEVVGTASYFGYAALLPFAALLMAAGLCSVERRSRRGGTVMLALMAASFALLCAHLFGESFTGNASMYLNGVAEASHAAAQEQKKTGASVNISCPPFQFANPQEGIEMLYLFGADMDTQRAIQGRGAAYRTFDPYADEADETQIYILCCDDEHVWPVERFRREQYGDYVLLTPKKTGKSAENPITEEKTRNPA